jgi:HEAT repeat protein
MLFITLILFFGCATSTKSFSDLALDLKSINTSKRHNAAVQLWQFGDQAVPVLLEATKDKDERVQYVAIDSLASIGTPMALKALNDVVPTLKKYLKDNDPNKRQKAFELLSTIGTPEALNALNSDN